MPYWRISGLYGFYFASLGVLVPYWGLYLQYHHYSPAQIGELTAILMATKIIAPTLWGWIADKTQQGMLIVRLASLLSFLCFALILLEPNYLGFALIVFSFSFFWNASLPQFEANTFRYLGHQTHYYSRVRLWGSVGFVISVIMVGKLLDTISPDYLPKIILGLFLGIFIVSLWVPQAKSSDIHTDSCSIIQVLLRPEIIAFFVVCFLMQASHGPYYAFYSIYLEQAGYSKTLIGQLWALGVAAEVALFVIMHHLLKYYSLRNILLVSLFLTSLRWGMIGSSIDNLILTLFAQCLHAASFGSYHVVAIQLIHGYFKGSHQGRGQALYSSLSFGAGGAMGSLYSGYLWSDTTANLNYFIAMGLSLLALFVAWLYVGKD